MNTSRSTPRLRLTAVLLLGVLGVVAVSDRTWADGAAGRLLELAGLACIACAVLGRVWTSVYIAGYKDAHLVRHGPYSAVRHPLYALSMLATLGVGLATRSLAITVVLFAVFAAIYATAARAEDAYLRARHAASHADYAARVPAFLPRGGCDVPEAVEVRPRVLWKAFLDAGTMLGYYVLLQGADLLRTSGVTPAWFTLP
jgi:protein-S-isoprenylcysteine O-methyltransferase Ste14